VASNGGQLTSMTLFVSALPSVTGGYRVERSVLSLREGWKFCSTWASLPSPCSEMLNCGGGVPASVEVMDEGKLFAVHQFQLPIFGEVRSKERHRTRP
jgi:hypothetical protein